MNVRSFDWRDLPALHRLRDHTVFLNNSLLLTRGPLLIPGAMLSAFTPAVGIHTSIYESKSNNEEILIGQSMHGAGSQLARMMFLTPVEGFDQGNLLPLLEHLVVQSGQQGVLRLLAEVDENSPAFESLRRAGFGVYSWQRVWRFFDDSSDSIQRKGSWRQAADIDVIPVRSLYNNVAPGLVQQVEPFPGERLHGLASYNAETILAYAELNYGHLAIWVQPVVHPDVQDVRTLLADLVRSLPYRLSRPVYGCVRSYQSWLEPALNDLGAEFGPRQAVMVKNFSIAQKAVRSFSLPALESGHPEVSAPIARSENSS